MEGLKSFCMHSEQPGSWMVHCGRTRGSLQGQQGLSCSDYKIGTGVRCEGYKCKHTQRKWVTIPTLLLAHCASPRISETDAKSWPLGAFGSLNKQMLPWQFLAGFCCDLLFKRAWCRVCMPVTGTGFVLGLTVHRCELYTRQEYIAASLGGKRFQEHNISFKERSLAGWGKEFFLC